MSELICEIIKLEKWAKHPNADTLGITNIYNFPVIFKLGEFQEGEKLIYFPIESVVPERKEFEFLWTGKINPTEKQRMIRAKKLRGIFSMGFLMPARLFNLEHLEIGTNVAELIGVKKYIPLEDEDEYYWIDTENRANPTWFHEYTSIQNIRKYSRIFIPGEEIVCTEKIHGSNIRISYHDDEIFVGSHHRLKRNDNENMWTNVIKEYDLENKLKNFPNDIFFGELYGKTQAKEGYNYGLKDGKCKLVFFDIYNLEKGRYEDYEQAKYIIYNLGLETTPEIYKGPFISFEEIEKLSDGPSILCNGIHNREGVVIKTTKESWNNTVGRKILKIHGETFLLRKKQ